MTSSMRDTIRRLGCIAIVTVLLGLAGGASAQTSVLCLGDSITYGLGCVDDNRDYPVTLETLLNSSGAGMYTVSRDAVCGLTVDGMLGRLQSTSSALKSDPDIVTILLGTNDINGATDRQAAVGETLNDMQTLVNYIANYSYTDGDAPTIYVSAVVPMVDPTTSSYVQQLNAVLDSSLTGATFFTENWDDLYNSATGGAYSALMTDNLHPNDMGHDIMAENFRDAIVTTPEPASITLLACGALAMVRRRRK